jgi:diguanylate cyclase (GGDEF)-like protein
MEKDKDLKNLDEYVQLSDFTNMEIGVAAAKTINEAMEQVMDKIGEIFSPVTHAFLLIDKETEKLYFKFVQGKCADKLADHKIAENEGLAGWVLENKKPDFIEDASKDSRLSKSIDKLTDFEIKSMIAVPLEVTEKTIGVFQLINKTEEGTYTADDLNIMKTIVEYASMAIEKVYYLSAMKDLDNVDSLTGVYKRSYFESQFEKEEERAKRYNNPLSMFIVNIDDFKTINDDYGHESGDQILKDLAVILKNSVRRVDIVARYGGDEFVILLPQTSKGNAELVRERIEKDISKGSKKGSVPYSVSIGLGSAGAKAAGSVIEKAEKDLQKQKKSKEETSKKKRKK